MIIGKDKERVRDLQTTCILANQLIEELKNDLEEVGEYLKATGMDITDEPICSIWYYIGRCKGHLDNCK